MFQARKRLCLFVFQTSRLNNVLLRLNSTLPESAPVSLFNKWISFWNVLINDYKDVVLDIGKNVKNKPIKSAIYCCIVGLTSYGCSLNPDETHYRESVLRKANELMFIPKAIRNDEAVEYLDGIEWLYNCGEIQKINFGICTLILRNFKSNSVCLFKYNCPYVQPTYLEILQNYLIDVGFWDKWWNLEKIMQDSDINPKEWK